MCQADLTLGLEQARSQELTYQRYANAKQYEKGKLKAPSAKGQAVGVNDHSPHNTDYETELIRSIHSSSILAGTKLEIMQCAVARSPKVCISAHGIQIPPLLDLGSDVMLLRQAYFEKNISCLRFKGQQVKRPKPINYSTLQSPMMGSFQSKCILS